ncbi:SH3 domain-containing protein [Streptomyces sp. SID8379]|uniref:SH3 domain-containing protein n=1 Tax=unclassified Streptomyces TaxID=2593676 RepID=UPI000998B95D|nr:MULTISPECIES: SH3 domain-containing protein [unclassified Streptomyces]MYW70231.1 SH3 domain-containing protein [Streptomyces sp. SID8379]
MTIENTEHIENIGNTENAENTAGVESAASTASTASAATYPVAPGYNVNVRSGPGTQYRVVRALPLGARVQILCQKPGTTVTGPYGTTKIWDSIGVGEYVSDAYVKTGSDGYVAPRCA